MNSSEKTPAPASRQKSSGFIWFIIIAFGLMLAVWLTLFLLAAEHPVKEIPMTHGGSTAQIDTPRGSSGSGGMGDSPMWIGCHGRPAHASDSSAA